MKVIAAVVLALASASAIGSGPYLPSGWRPQGPAFYLPSEVQKPAENPLKETILIESEASGSEGLREYGPPKVEHQESLSSVQTLPDVVTDQAFYVAEQYVEKVDENVEQAEEYVENKAEQIQAEVLEEPKADIVEITEAVTEAVTQAKELIDARNLDVEEQTTATAIAEIVAVTEGVTEVQEVEATAVALTEALQNIVQEEITEEFTKADEENNAVVLGNLAIEVKAEQNVEADSELKNQEGSASMQVPEGFLEYGPPGFREYGPPKADQLQRSSLENNEVRRRRFSPKFRSSKVLKH